MTLGNSKTGHCGALRWRLGLNLIVILLSVLLNIASVEAQPNAALEARVKQLGTSNGPTIAGSEIAAVEIITKFYAQRAYKPAWTDPRDVEALQIAVADSPAEGLLPADFHAAALANLSGLAPADREILLSDALARLLFQLFYGKLQPNKFESTWNFARPVAGQDPVSAVSAALDSHQLAKLIDDVKLKHPFYGALKDGLARFRAIASKGGWDAVPPGAVLKKGARDPRVTAVRNRLIVTGEYAGPVPAEPEVFDASLETAVKRFQVNYALDADGVVGNTSIAAMNVTVEARIDQIRGSLERARWVLRSSLSQDMIIVNIAAYRLRLFFGSRIAWETRVVVGKTYTQTPVFTEPLKTIVFNPDWTVPSSIARNEIVPKAKENPSYLADNNYILKDSKGQVVDPAAVDWSKMSSSSFPYTIVQTPGPHNALGVVKFLFPNKYSVYLHDTNSKTLFDKSTRTFSHGCIRVEDPLKLAELILARKKGWTRAQIDQTVASGKLTNVGLSGDVTVLLLYWTADPSSSSGIVFYQDAYGRDAKLISALNART